MNRNVLSILLCMSAIPAASVVAENQSILPGGCIRTEPIYEDLIPWVAANRDFIIETQIDEIIPHNYIEWALFKHDELELINYDFRIQKSMFSGLGFQSWTFKASRPGTYTMSFMRNGEIKTVSVYAYHDWCGTEPRAEASVITF